MKSSVSEKNVSLSKYLGNAMLSSERVELIGMPLDRLASIQKRQTRPRRGQAAPIPQSYHDGLDGASCGMPRFCTIEHSFEQSERAQNA
jgi:hypothetical protein